LTISCENKPLADLPVMMLADVPVMTLADFAPRGSTPLYDAIGECARRVEANGRAVTVVVITDRMENASKEFTRESVKALIKGK
jgi:Mg-chelatase subunit ChlD